MIPLYITWDVSPEIFRLFGVAVHWYSLLFVAGLMISYLILRRVLPGTGISLSELDRFSLCAAVGIFLGARLGHCFFYDFAYFQQHPWEIILPVAPDEQGVYRFTGYRGLASHGGVLGLLAALFAYVRTTGKELMPFLDLSALVAPLAGCFIRVGNLMNSEIIGIPSDLPWSFVFTSVDLLPRHPAQLYEAFVYFAIFCFSFFFLYRKYPKTFGTGFFTGFALVAVFAARFLIEFVKERQSSFEENMTIDMGQWLSVPFIVAGIILMMLSGRLRNTER